MPSSYLLIMPYASGSGGNPVSGSLSDGDDVNVTLLGRIDSFAEVYLGWTLRFYSALALGNLWGSPKYLYTLFS